MGGLVVTVGGSPATVRTALEVLPCTIPRASCRGPSSARPDFGWSTPSTVNRVAPSSVHAGRRGAVGQAFVNRSWNSIVPWSSIVSTTKELGFVMS